MYKFSKISTHTLNIELVDSISRDDPNTPYKYKNVINSNMVHFLDF